jgi:succinate dehydrogenase / fumarate reductase iron-sulfur subunit
VLIEHWQTRTLRHADAEETGWYRELLAERPELHDDIIALTRDHELLRILMAEIQGIFSARGIAAGIVEAMLGYAVIRDLVVDMDQFFAKYEKVKPYLINDEPPPRTERLQSPEERARYDESTKCILCGACTGSCPQVWANPRWVGPASIVNAHRFIFDSRDEGAAERLRILSDYDGVWPCKTIFNCTECCPRGIPVTDTIEQVKRAILYGTNETE